MGTKKKNPNAVALGSRGGKARAKNMSPAKLSAIGEEGAKQRNKNLDAGERKKIARKAAKARWLKAKEQEEQ